MTREQNVVALFYLLAAAGCARIFFGHWSATFFVGFLLAFILKVVNSVAYNSLTKET